MSEDKTKIKEWIDDEMEEVVVLEPREQFDQAIVGWVERFNQPAIICYDVKKVINSFVENGMTEEDAWEWYSYNTVGAWFGENTPCFLHIRETE